MNSRQPCLSLLDRHHKRFLTGCSILLVLRLLFSSLYYPCCYGGHLGSRTCISNSEHREGPHHSLLPCVVWATSKFLPMNFKRKYFVTLLHSSIPFPVLPFLIFWLSLLRDGGCSFSPTISKALLLIHKGHVE